ncbi:hypothetical protein AYL99_11748 [Fonsecaea erecta]|uniref:Uncharacterized protein n=1 Tax=Fonsecaea erecta TaxID=1367422 RepID=A0A178Z4V1_9EURO|nr:hypothetical protein AYL99_11748 [Fonsecaea erecta]OAP54213.1 hypothetical protein AYL99_11748 [Fonsecaea erecta]
MLRLSPTKKDEVVVVEWPVIGTVTLENGGHGDTDDTAVSAASRAAAGLNGPLSSSPTSSRPANQRTGTGTGLANAETASLASSTSSASTSNPTSCGPGHGSLRTILPPLTAQEWRREWQFAILKAALSGRKGRVTLED